MWIKICGNTNVEDALVARELGAHALGFVFVPSKRQVTAAQVAAITAELPGDVETIGVFGPQDADAILDAVRAAGLSGVQVHGGFDAARLQRLREGLGAPDGRVRLVQGMHWEASATEEADRAAAELAAIAACGFADAVLVDSRTPAASGGTGVRFDWVAAQAAIAGAGMQVIVAGGLNPENVADAIAALRPFGVDVVSGVEASAGRKDAAKMASFVRNASCVIQK